METRIKDKDVSGDNMKRFMPFFALILLFCLGSDASEAQTYAVIANPSNPIKEINISTLRNFYSGKLRNWKKGERVVVINLKGKIQRDFYKAAFHQEDFFLKQGLPFEGDRTLRKTNSMLRFVAKYPGAIGYLLENEVNEKVKVILLVKID